MMFRKHYNAFADALLEARVLFEDNADQHAQWCRDVQAIADVLEADNPRFDRRRFLEAAGLGRFTAVA